MTDHNVAAQAEMLIRRPVEEVFAAFVDPEQTAKFWFTRGSDRLASGKRVVWEWAMYGASVPVEVKDVQPNRRILVEWGTEAPTAIEWQFTPRPGGTFVSITNSGFSGDAAEVCRQAIASTEGFAFVLAALKALLEHGVALNLVADRRG
jgi:uncharacterized protein YndB with AHSA1/START domain